MRKKILHILLFVFVSIIFLGAALLFNSSNRISIRDEEKPQNPTPGLQAGDFRKESERLSLYIDKVGVEHAYNEFKKEYHELAHYHRHLFTHIFGALLYQKVGIEGVSTCDDFAAFGCYHGTVAQLAFHLDL